MVEVFCLLGACSILAFLCDRCRNIVRDRDGNLLLRDNQVTNFIFWILWIILILFSGLRTVMNDTAIYLSNFATKVPDSLGAIKDINMDIGSNPLFSVYQILIKVFISDNGSVFLLITAIIVVSSYLLFLKKYSKYFSYSIYLLISFTVYAFTMAAIKQTLAIAIAIWAVPLWLEKKKAKAVLLILIAMFIHPYIVVYFSAFFLSENIWDKRTALLVILTIIAGLGFATLIESLINVASSIGDTYDEAMFTEGSISIARMFVYLVTPVLSFVYRNSIRNRADKLTYVFINLSIISTCFILLARLGGANLFGRLANYFDIFQCIALPVILNYGVKDERQRGLLKFVSVLCFAFFYYTYYTKYMSYNTCIYYHISLLDVLRDW